MKIIEKLFKPKYILIGIIVIAALLRIWTLGIVPPSPDWDEASLGYNAFSIMETGKDEYGKFMPIILRSFDDYKPALYTYFIIPFIKVFGLNIISVRLPSVLFGIVLVLSTYFLAKELFGKKGEVIGLVSSFLLAISPWHLQFSRIAFEAQVGLSLNILSVLFFIKGMKRPQLLLPAAIFASLSIYIYQSEKVYLPILFLVLAIIYWRDLMRIPKKWVLSALLVGIILSFPMMYDIATNKEALMRARGVSVFSDQTQFLKGNVGKVLEDKKNNDAIGLLIDNRRVEYGKAVISGYISHFDFNWLFVKGDIERHHAPFMGLMYLFELPFFLTGIYLLFFGDFSKKTKLTILSIILITPIPASITSGVPHAVRAINFLPVIQIFTAFGLIQSFRYVSKLKFKKIIYCFTVLFFVFNFAYFLDQYFVQQNYYFSENWQYGYEKAIKDIKPIMGYYEKIVVSNDRPLDQSYIFFLFYLGYSPSSYQNEVKDSSGGFRENHSFGKFQFRNINWEKEDKNKVLFLGRPEDFPPNVKKIDTVNYLNGKPAIIVVKG